MMKKMWNTPRTIVQNFEPNEYVAACFQLVCHRGSEGNPYDLGYWNGVNETNGVTHSPIGTPHTCADASANRVITDDGGIFQSVGEFNGEQGWINGGMTGQIDNDHDGVISAGDTIFWYTESGSYWNHDYRRWNHWGVVGQQDPNHPNHS